MDVSYQLAETFLDESLVGELLELAGRVFEMEALQLNHALQQLNEASGFKATGVRFDKAEAMTICRKHKQ
jgi:hypothetical protein